MLFLGRLVIVDARCHPIYEAAYEQVKLVEGKLDRYLDEQKQLLKTETLRFAQVPNALPFFCSLSLSFSLPLLELIFFKKILQCSSNKQMKYVLELNKGGLENLFIPKTWQRVDKHLVCILQAVLVQQQ